MVNKHDGNREKSEITFVIIRLFFCTAYWGTYFGI